MSLPEALPSSLGRLPASATNCFGCPGGHSSKVGVVVVGFVVVAVGLALLVLSQRRDHKERIGVTDRRAASLRVTVGRAIGVLLIIIGLLTAITRP